MTNSSRTSRNILAGAFKKINWKENTSNFDLGGGKYEKATEFLKTKGVINHVYDPYNRSKEHNREAWEAGDKALTSTLCNVLNVISTKTERIKLLRQAKRKNTQKIYITVYEKDKSGIGSKTRDGWQNNMIIEDYLSEVYTLYADAYIKNKMIVVNV